MFNRDERCVQQLRNNNRAAFEDVVERHYQSIFRQLWHLCGQRQVAAELTQETFIQAWKSLDSFSGRSALRTWLHTIAVRVWHRWQSDNSQQRHEHAPLGEWADALPDGSPGPAQLLETQMIHQEVHKALLQLPVAYREVLVLFYIQGMKYREVAAVLDIPLGTVKSRLHEGLQRMKALLLEAEGNFVEELNYVQSKC